MANEVEIRIVTDTANADAQLNKLKGTTGGLNTNLATSAKRFALMGTAVVAAGAGVALATKKIFDMAANLELVENKINVVFGEQGQMVANWADTVSERMGLSSLQAQGLAANFADLLIPMKFTREQAAQMSTDIIGLSGALAEWSGGTRTTAEVSDILGKAMLGEREAIKSLGISITEADVKNKILSMSTQQLSGLTEAQAKAIATRDLILEKSIDAQTAYAENTDGLSVTQAKLSSAFEEAKETLIRELQPALADLAEFLKDSFIPFMEEVAIPAFGKLIQAGIKIGEAFAFVGNMADKLTPKIRGGGGMEGAIEALGTILKETHDPLDQMEIAFHNMEAAAAVAQTEVKKLDDTTKKLNDTLTATSLAQALIAQGFFDLDIAAQQATLQQVADQLFEARRAGSQVDQLAKSIEAMLPGNRFRRDDLVTGPAPEIGNALAGFEGLNRQNLIGAVGGDGPNKFGFNLTAGLGAMKSSFGGGIGGTASSILDAFRQAQSHFGFEADSARARAVANTLGAQAIQQNFITVESGPLQDPVAIGDKILEVLKVNPTAQSIAPSTIFGGS
jgi:hypothetical protein